MAESSFWLTLVTGTTAVPKAIGKLIETVGEQAGLLMEPIHVRRMAEAEAVGAIAKARAAAEIKTIKVGNHLLIQELEDRAAEFRRRQADRQFQNVESVTAKAVEELKGTQDQQVSDTPVDSDWIADFYGHCQEVSNEQMQQLWGKILAGEVRQPGTFSLRTLAAVKLLRHEDAELFRRLCTAVWSRGGPVVIYPFEWYSKSDMAPVSRVEMDYLDMLGLVKLAEAGRYQLRSFNGVLHLEYFGTEYMILPKEKSIEDLFKAAEVNTYWPDFDIEVAPCWLTPVGRELVQLANAEPDEAYREAALKEFPFNVCTVVNYTDFKLQHGIVDEHDLGKAED